MMESHSDSKSTHSGKRRVKKQNSNSAGSDAVLGDQGGHNGQTGQGQTGEKQQSDQGTGTGCSWQQSNGGEQSWMSQQMSIEH